MIGRTGDAGPLRAVRAAEERRSCLHAMTDDAAATVIADWRQFVDGAFEAVEHMSLPGCDHFEREMVIVAAHFTLSHGCFAFRVVQLLPGGPGNPP
jgi:hypothetical protein